MSSSRASTRDTGLVAFDPEALLVRDPGVLLDPRFLGALHREFVAELGEDAAAVTLLQMGLLHGLRDAARVVAAGFDRTPGGEPLLQASPLPLRLRSAPWEGRLELRGCWPERTEAEALLGQLGRGAEPRCWLSAGYTSGWLSGILDLDVVALEQRCCTRGDEACDFVAREAGAWLAEGDDRTRALVATLPFAALRGLIAGELPQPGAAEAAGLDGEEPVVHIWGPVMVVPFAGADEAQLAVELVGRDPGATQVSVIVLDLTGAIIDEAFGAAALERILDSIEGCGAEAVFAGVSPLSEAVVAGLERQPLLVRKDLHAGIAAAFQIADSQRRLL